MSPAWPSGTEGLVVNDLNIVASTEERGIKNGEW